MTLIASNEGRRASVDARVELTCQLRERLESMGDVSPVELATYGDGLRRELATVTELLRDLEPVTRRKVLLLIRQEVHLLATQFSLVLTGRLLRCHSPPPRYTSHSTEADEAIDDLGPLARIGN